MMNNLSDACLPEIKDDLLYLIKKGGISSKNILNFFTIERLNEFNIYVDQNVENLTSQGHVYLLGHSCLDIDISNADKIFVFGFDNSHIQAYVHHDAILYTELYNNTMVNSYAYDKSNTSALSFDKSRVSAFGMGESRVTANLWGDSTGDIKLAYRSVGYVKTEKNAQVSVCVLDEATVRLFKNNKPT